MTKWLYLILAVIGFILPNILVVQVLSIYGGFDAGRFVSDSTANLFGQFVFVDLLVSATVGVIFIIQEGLRQKVRFWWVALIGMAAVGFCFGLPLFLFLRELSLEKKNSAQ